MLQYHYHRPKCWWPRRTT